MRNDIIWAKEGSLRWFGHMLLSSIPSILSQIFALTSHPQFRMLRNYLLVYRSLAFCLQ